MTTNGTKNTNVVLTTNDTKNTNVALTTGVPPVVH